MLTSPEILVPMDFSPCSVNALRVAVGMAAPDGDLTLLHVVDEDFVRDAVAAGMGMTDDLRSRLKEQAEASFANVMEGIEECYQVIIISRIVCCSCYFKCYVLQAFFFCFLSSSFAFSLLSS